MKTKLFVVLMLVGVALAQATKTTPPVKPDLKQPVFADPKVLSASLEVENKILRAEHKKDTARLLEQQAQDEFLKLQKIYNDAWAVETAADADIQAAIDQAYTDKGLSKIEYAFDPDNFTFVAKPKPALVTPDLKEKK